MMSSVAVKATDIHRTIDAVWRIEAAKVIARISRLVRDVGLAEELAQDALLAALEQWPRSGIPDNPGAWLTTAAKNRAIDLIRRNKLLSASTTSSAMSWNSNKKRQRPSNKRPTTESVMTC